MTKTQALAIKALGQESCKDWYDVPSEEMTLEQARQAVKDLRKKLAEYLEQEPGEDCVSRKAILDAITKIDDNINMDIYTNEVREIVKELPPVIPAQSWTPIEVREPTQEEKEEYLTEHGEELCYMVESRMPEDGQEVLVSHGNYVTTDVFLEEFWNFEDLDIENVEAWMPLPKPYEEKRGNKDGSN